MTSSNKAYLNAKRLAQCHAGRINLIMLRIYYFYSGFSYPVNPFPFRIVPD